MGFKQWSENRLKLESQYLYTQQPLKKWSAGKDEILNLWRSLNPNDPLKPRPISPLHKGSTYGEDGIRITGSTEFISSVLSKLKSFLTYESPTTKLAVSYRETQSPSQLEKGNLKKSYVLYIQVKERESIKDS